MMVHNICKSCGNKFTGKYCNSCGEKVYTINDKRIKNLFSEAFHFLTHFEGTLLTTIKTLFTKPGMISLDYCNGQRKKYYKPLSFFLFLVILYLIFPVFEGLNMKLRYHELNGFYGNYATEKIQDYLSLHNISHDELETKFHKAGEKASKFLLFIIIPMLALLSWVLAFKRRKLYYDHFIFSIELSSFYVLFGYLITPLIFLLLIKLSIIKSDFSDSFVGLFIVTVFSIYTFIAAKRFFNFKIPYNIFYTLMVSVIFNLAIIMIYKFFLFFISINLI